MKALSVPLLLLSGVLAPPLVVWADPNFDAAQTTFLKATTGDANAVDAAIKQFDALLAREPRNPMFIAYRGSAMAMRAREVNDPWKKSEYSEEGVAELERALALLKPEEANSLTGMRTQFVASNVFLRVPESMNRRAQGERLLNGVLASPEFASAPPAFRSSVLKSALDTLGPNDPQRKRLWAQQLQAAQTAQGKH